jgi:hypothetical protein
VTDYDILLINNTEINNMTTIPGVVKAEDSFAYDDRDAMLNIMETIDNRLDDVIGARPLRAVGRIATSIAPANVINNFTNIPKPSQAIEGAQDNIERDLSSTSKRLF